MRHIVLGTVGGILLAGLLLFGTARIRDRSQTDISPTDPSPVQEEEVQPNEPAVDTHQKDVALLVRTVESKSSQEVWEEVILVKDGDTHDVKVPDGVDQTEIPVTDGTRIYFIVDRDERKIVSVLPNGEEEIVQGTTPLLRPRKLSMSPDGSALAYFMDNTRRALTELWTYRTKEKRSLVSLELLAADAGGPYWDQNSGFLVLSDNTVLRGTPLRTGYEQVAVERNEWKDLVSENPVVPSPTGNQVIYALNEKKNSTNLMVWDVREQQERIATEFPETDVRLLGWSAANSLIVQVGLPNGTLWSVTPNEVSKIPFNEERIAWSEISGDGEVVAVLESGENTNITFIELTSGRVRDTVESLNEGVRLVQFLRIPDDSSMTLEGVTTDSPLAQERILRYVMEHLQEITDAPSAERAVAERVWFADIPGVLYLDYRIGTTLWRRLIIIEEMDGESFTHQVLAVYAPVAGEWIVTRGQEPPGMLLTVLYEYNEEIEKWVIQP